MSYKCSNCGSSLNYIPGTDSLGCAYCGSRFPVRNFAVNAGADESKDEYGVVSFICKSCGAQMLSTDEQIVSYCSYCGGEAVLQSKMGTETRPRFIIPFHITKESCRKIYKKGVSKIPYLPGALKKDEYLERFRGIYIPYWNYDIVFNTNTAIEAKDYRRDGNERIESTYRIDMNVAGTYTGVPYDASSFFDDTISEAIMPFDKREIVDFDPGYLAGFYADRADVGSEAYEAAAKVSAANEAYLEVGKKLKKSGYKTVVPEEDDMVSSLRPEVKERFPVLFPVWFLTWKNRDRVAYSIVNGQTGKMSADMPVDGRKFALGTAITAVLMFVLLTFLLSATARTALGVCDIIMMCAMALFGSESARIANKENHVFDPGWSVKGNKVEMPDAIRAARSRGRKDKVTKNVDFTYLAKVMATFAWVALPFAISLYGAIPAFYGYMLPSMKLKIASGVTLVVVVFLFTKCMASLRYVTEKSMMLPALLALAGAVMAFGVSVWDPVADIYYYAAALTMAAISAVTAFSLIKYYDLLSTRPVPSFFTREGGNDRAK